MSLRKNLLLMLVLAGLGAYLYFVELPRDTSDEPSTRLFTAAADVIRSLTLEHTGETVELARGDDDEWHLVRPLESKADQGVVRTVLAALTDAKVSRTLEAGGDPAAFGLDTDAIAVTLTSQDGSTQGLRVGKNTPVGDSVYVQRDQEAAVLLTAASLRSILDKEVDDLRDKRVFDFEDHEVQWVEIDKPMGTARIERHEDRWQVVGEPTYPGDTTAVQTYLASLRSLRVAKFVADAPEDLTLYGLVEPRLTVRVGLEGEREVSVRFGSDKAGTEYHAQAAPGGNVFTVNDWAYRNLDKGTRDLRDKSILSLSADAVRAVSVMRRDQEPYRIVREDDGWSIHGVEGTAKAAQIDEFIGDLVGLAGYEIVADQPDALAAFGLDAPQLQISLYGLDDVPLGSVVFGKTVGADGIHHFHAKSDQTDMVVLVRSYIFNRLDQDPKNLVEGSDDGEAAAPDVEDPHAGHEH